MRDNPVVQWLAQHPYFGWSVLLLMAALLTISFWPGEATDRRWQQRLLGLAGVFCAPFGLFSFMYIPRYWRPELTCWFGPASPEDIIFAAATGSIAMSLPLAFYRRRLTLQAFNLRLIARRYACFAVFGISFGYAVLFIFRWQIDTMLACLLAVAASASLIYRTRPDLLRLSLPGVLFVPLYWISLHLAFFIWPEFIRAWDAPEQLPQWWIGVPAYELLWALGFGTVWPLFIAWCCGVRWQAQAGQA